MAAYRERKKALPSHPVPHTVYDRPGYRTSFDNYCTMKRTFTFLLAALAIAAFDVQAQDKSVATSQSPESPVVQEKRLTAGALKETHGALTEQLNVVKKLAGSVDRIAAKRFVEIQSEVQAELDQVEGALDGMRSVDDAQWPAFKAECDRLNSTLKSSIEARNKGLAEAYGEKGE
jgi:hypothetical protein